MKKLQILQAALKLFVKKGFHGTSTAEIAKKAEVANGTLFHYFETKEALINNLYLEVKDNFFIHITEKYGKDLDLKERMVQLIYSIINWASEYDDEFRFTLQFSNSPYMESLTDEQKMRHEQFFNDLFREGISTNIFKDLPVKLLMQLYFAQINGLILFIIGNPEILKNRDEMNIAIEAIWDSISL